MIFKVFLFVVVCFAFASSSDDDFEINENFLRLLYLGLPFKTKDGNDPDFAAILSKLTDSDKSAIRELLKIMIPKHLKEATKLNEEAGKDEKALKVEEARTDEKAKKNEEALKDKEALKDEEARKDEGASKDEESLKDEQAIKVEEARKNEEARQDEEALRDNDGLEDEEALKDEEARQNEKALKVEEALMDEEALKHATPEDLLAFRDRMLKMIPSPHELFEPERKRMESYSS